MSQFVKALLRTNQDDFPALAHWICHDEPKFGMSLMREGLIQRSGDHAYWTNEAIEMRKAMLASRRRKS